MAEIQEYTPQVEAQGPVGQTSPNLELAGSVGRSLERLGGAIEEGGQYIHQRKAQEETADVYARMADQREFWTNEVQTRAQNGTLDTDKIKEDYDNATSSIGDNISTSQGKNYFERQQARVKSHVLQMAQASAAQMAAAQAMGSFKSGMDKDSSTLMSDPTAFEDVYNGGLESVDQLIATGGLPAKMRDRAVEQMSSQYAQAAMKGWTDSDPEMARKMLPELGKFLNVQQKEQAERGIDMAERASDVEDARTEKAVKDAHVKAEEAWGQNALPKLANNTLSTRDVLAAVKDGTLDWEKGERWLGMIEKGAKDDVKTNPRLKNDLIQRMVDPNSPNPITSQDELMPYVGKGLSIPDFNSMNGLLNKTPEGQAAQQGERALFQAMKSTIRYKNPMTNQYDVAGEQKLAQAMSDYIHAKGTIKQSGGKPSDLVDPNSPLYFGKSIGQYQTSLQDQMSGMAQDRTNKALGIDRTKDPNAPEAPADKNVKQKNETPAQYLKRRGLGG